MSLLFNMLEHTRGKNAAAQSHSCSLTYCSGMAGAFHRLVEAISKGQMFQTCWESHALQTLAEMFSKGQRLKVGKINLVAKPCQGPIRIWVTVAYRKIRPGQQQKEMCLEASENLRTPLEHAELSKQNGIKTPIFRPGAPSKLWLKFDPKVKLRRLGITEFRPSKRWLKPEPAIASWAVPRKSFNSEPVGALAVLSSIV